MSFAAVTTVIPSNSSDALFRTWGSAISAKLLSAGWVKTSDTGQINWVTVTAPAGVSTAQGYEIWRMADTLQSVAPIFLKIEFGSFTVALGNPAIWITIGTGSNGSGTLTGPVLARRTVGCNLTATLVNWYWSGDTHRFCFAISGAAGNTSLVFSIERILDNTGALTSEGATLIVRTGGAWEQIVWSVLTGPYTAAWETSLGALPPTVAPWGVYGTEVSMYPIYHHKGVYLPYGMNGFAYFDATLTAGSPVTFTVYGAVHTFMPLGTTGFAAAFRTNLGTSAYMMRYE